MKNIKTLLILFSFVSTILKSQTIIEKSTLLKEITEFHDDGIPKTINYLNENLELVIQEKYDIFSDLISSYQFNPKTQKKDGPFVYYPYSNIYNEGFRNSKNDFDFKNVINKGIYEDGIIIKCEDCEFFIESENPNYSEFKQTRRGDILNGRFIGEVSIFYMSEGSSIGSIQSISDQLTSYYGRKVNYTMSFRNGNFSKKLLYRISFDSLGYVKDGVYNFKRNKYYYKNKILSGIITYNENNNIPKDSIFTESKVWKINNKFSKNTGWITSEEKIINPLNFKLSNKYGGISPINQEDEGYDETSKLDNLYSLSSERKFYTTGKSDPTNLIFFGSEKSELKNMFNPNNNYITDKRDKEFHGFNYRGGQYPVSTPFFTNLGISLLRTNKLDSNGIFSFYNHEIIFKYANLYLSGILKVNKNIDEITTSPIIDGKIIDYNNFSFQFKPTLASKGNGDRFYYYNSDLISTNKWSVFDYTDKYLQNKTIDSLKKDVRINFSNLNIDNYQKEEYIKYNSYSASDWFEKIKEKSQKEGKLIFDENLLMYTLNNYTIKIEKLLIDMVKLTNSKGSEWKYSKYSPFVFDYQSYLPKKIRETKDPKLLRSLINFQLGTEENDLSFFKIKKLKSLNYIDQDGNFSDSFKMIFEILIKDIENDVYKIENFLNVRELYLDIFYEKENITWKTVSSKINDSDFNNWYYFVDEDERKYFQDIKKIGINYIFKNPKKVIYLRKFIKKFGEDRVNYWNDIFSKKTIENRFSYLIPDIGRENNENIDITMVINENYIDQDFSELLSHLYEVKEYLSNFK